MSPGNSKINKVLHFIDFVYFQFEEYYASGQ